MYAQAKVQRAYQQYKKVPNDKRLSGAETARRILHANGLENVQVEVAKMAYSVIIMILFIMLYECP